VATAKTTKRTAYQQQHLQLLQEQQQPQQYGTEVSERGTLKAKWTTAYKEKKKQDERYVKTSASENERNGSSLSCKSLGTGTETRSKDRSSDNIGTQRGRDVYHYHETIMENVKLDDIEVQVDSVRMTIAGSILLQVKGKEKADRQTCHLKNAVGERPKIQRPSRNTPMMAINIPEWMVEEQIGDCIRAADPSLVNTVVKVRDNIGRGRVAQFMASMG